MMKKFINPISGHLDITVIENEDFLDGEKMEWKEVLIHGDTEGLKSLAEQLIKLANLNQEQIKELPIGAREHIHLRPNLELSKSSKEAVIGRLDAKGSGEFYSNYLAKD